MTTWINFSPDANGLQNDPTFHDITAFPLNVTRQTSAFDPHNNNFAAPGVARPRIFHCGLEAHTGYMSEPASSNLMVPGSAESLAHPSWNTVSNCTAAQDGTDPGGLPTWTLTPTTASGTHYYGQTIAFPPGASVVSFYVKANGYTGLGIGLWDNNNSTYLQGNFDLSTGMDTAGTAVGSESLGGGWYRVWITRSWAAGASSLSNFSINVGQNASTFSYAGDGVSGILVTQPCIEPGMTVPTSWITGRNVLLNSEQLSAVNWTTNGPITVTNAASAGRGGRLSLSSLFESSTASGVHDNFQVVTKDTASLNYVLSGVIKAGPGARNIEFLITDSGSNGCYADFNPNSGTIQTAGTLLGTGFSVGTPTITSLGSGLYFCQLPFQSNNGSELVIYTRIMNGSTPSYVGTIGDGIYCGELQLEPTGFNVTAYPDPLNLLQGASNLADAGHWGGGAILGVSTFVTDPFGGDNAFTLTNGGGGAYGALYQSISGLPAGIPVLISVYLKWGNTTASYVQIYDSTASTGRGILEVAWDGSGHVTNVTSGAGLTVLGFLPMTGGWYRIMALSASGIIPGNVNAFYLYPGVLGSEGVGDFCYAYGPQITTLAASPYWGNNASVGGRDTENVWANISGITDPRLNYLTYSERFNTWTQTGCTVTANAGTDPNGNMYADDLIEDSSTGFHYLANVSASVTTGTFTTITRIKPTGRSWVCLDMYDEGASVHRGVYFHLSGAGATGSAFGSGVTSSAITGPDAQGYYRCVFVVTLVGAGDYNIISASADGMPNPTGINASALRLFGAQCVPGSSDPGPAGYIPTQPACTTTQLGISTTDGSLIAFGLPYERTVSSGNYYTHVGNANLVMDPAGQMYRGVNAGGVVAEAPGVLDVAIMTWSTEADEVLIYGAGVQIGTATLGEGNCPLVAVEDIPIGSLYGADNFRGWVWLGYAHQRVYTPSDVKSITNAAQNS